MLVITVQLGQYSLLRMHVLLVISQLLDRRVHHIVTINITK